MLIHSIQTLVETDDPEPAAAPAFPGQPALLGRDSQSTDTVVDAMTEEALLRGLQRLTPMEASPNTGASPDRAPNSEF